MKELNASPTIIANERAGSWYCLPYTKSKSRQRNSHSAHFKSTDGHRNIYNFSLKRMNFDFLHTAVQASRKGQCTMIVDASKYKTLPDSFNATLPLWCSVLNRAAMHYFNDEKLQKSLLINTDPKARHDNWDTNLFVPSNVTKEEYDEMLKVIPERVESVIHSGVILNPGKFIKSLQKPLRCFWIWNNHQQDDDQWIRKNYKDIHEAMNHYTCILCVNCSDSISDRTHGYISGAGDDEQSWSLGLTPSLFWKHHEELLRLNDRIMVENMIRNIVSSAKLSNEEWYRSSDLPDDANAPLSEFYDTIGQTGISIGSRRSGKPPNCWEHFDAIVNVTTIEYEELSTGEGIPKSKYYLHIPVEEGKRDRTELERWLPLAIFFVGVHAVTYKRRVLIHCAQGMDRSVAIAIACVCIFCLMEHSESPDESLKFFDCWSECHDHFVDYLSMAHFITNTSECDNVHVKKHKFSGIPEPIVDVLAREDGRNVLFAFLRHESKRTDHQFWADKNKCRLALLYIQQFRIKANPTRKTMQKLNRFFMTADTFSKLHNVPKI